MSWRLVSSVSSWHYKHSTAASSAMVTGPWLYYTVARCRPASTGHTRPLCAPDHSLSCGYATAISRPAGPAAFGRHADPCSGPCPGWSGGSRAAGRGMGSCNRFASPDTTSFSPGYSSTTSSESSVFATVRLLWWIGSCGRPPTPAARPTARSCASGPSTSRRCAPRFARGSFWSSSGSGSSLYDFA